MFYLSRRLEKPWVCDELLRLRVNGAMGHS